MSPIYTKTNFVNSTSVRLTALSAALAFFICLSAAQSAKAATFVVNSTADVQDAAPGTNGCQTATAGECTLRAAITEANALAGPDIITLPAGTYTETLLGAGQTGENANAGGDFDITSDITINGASAASTIVQANANPGVATERVFHIRAAAAATALTVVIDGVTVQNGRNAINAFGGGIRIDQGTSHNVTISNSTITNNLNDTSGGGLAISTAITPTVTITNSTFSNNRAGSATAGTSAAGGGIQINSASTVNITNTAINLNIATTSVASTNSFGGGIAVSTSSGVALTITGGTINNNTNTNTTATAGFAGYGGGMFFRDGNLIMNGTTVSGNSTSGPGGGIGYFGATATARTLSLTNVTIDNNTANNTGESGAGGINFDVFGSAASTLNITDSRITNNTSTAGTGIGGGLYNWSEVGGATTNITNSTISGNRATFGGGVFNESDGAGNGIVNLSRSAVTGNNSNGNGGGIYNFAASTTGGLATVNLDNSTVGANTSATNGGGITNEIATGATATGPTVNLNFSTVASNTATTNGGGLQQLSGAINIKNTIVADNSAATGPDIFGTITSQSYNHVENTAGGTFAVTTGDVTGTDPGLAALALNGGTTLNYLPAANSPVIDTIPNGTNGCGIAPFNVDQRGFIRPTDSNNDTIAACEKGSIERAASPTAAGTTVSGRVILPMDVGLTNARVTLTDSQGNSRTVLTGKFGSFTFADVASGETYIVSVSARHYIFAPQVISVTEDITGLVFTPQ